MVHKSRLRLQQNVNTKDKDSRKFVCFLNVNVNVNEIVKTLKSGILVFVDLAYCASTGLQRV